MGGPQHAATNKTTNTMKYHGSISDFFKMPKWLVSVLLGSVATMIPVVGPIVVSGWQVGGFWARGKDMDAEGFPGFDFQYFMKYLERGLWPFLVHMVASLALMPVLLVLMLVPLFSTGAFGAHAGQAGFELLGAVSVGLMISAMIVGYVLAMLAFSLITVPLMLRATITQNFTQAFNVSFVKDFLSRVWKETLLVFIYMFGVGLVMMIIAIITCYIGLFPCMVVVMYAWAHLQRQLYQLYLERGGEDIPLSAKLMDTPPALPPSAGMII
jgi:hypothetical protein